MSDQSDLEYGGETPSESKGFRITKNIFKGLLFGASALVWVLIFWVIIATREPSFYDSMIFTEKTKQYAETNTGYAVWRINVTTWMSYENSISVSNVWYSPETKELELGFRYNTKLLKRKDSTGNDFEDEVLYELSDNEGTVYTASALTESVIGRYHYYRVCYSDITLPMPEQGGTVDTDFELWFRLVRKSDGEPLSSYMEDGVRINDAEFRLFDRSTVCQLEEFDP